MQDNICSAFDDNISLKVFKLKTKYNSYLSFKTIIDNLDTTTGIRMFGNRYWPSGVLVKVAVLLFIFYILYQIYISSFLVILLKNLK